MANIFKAMSLSVYISAKLNPVLFSSNLV